MVLFSAFSPVSVSTRGHFVATLLLCNNHLTWSIWRVWTGGLLPNSLLPIWALYPLILFHTSPVVIVVLDLHAVAVDGDFLQQPLAARAIVRTVGIIRPVSGSPLGVVNKRTVPLSDPCLTQTQEQFKSPFLSHFIPQVSAYRHIVFHIPIPRNISF